MDSPRRTAVSAAPTGSGTAFAPQAAITEGWASLRGSAAIDIMRLPDAALGSCRVTAEWLALVGALIVFGVALGALLILRVQPVELGIAGFAAVWLADTALRLLVLSRQVGGAVEITPVQFDDLFPIVEELRGRFDLPAVRVFVSAEDDLPMGAYGLWPPYSIRFPSLLVAGVNVDEFRFLLGREMGAIRLGHPRLAFLFGGDSPVFANALQWILLPRQLIFSWWYRSQHLSRDRAGALACRSVRVAVTTLLKLHVRPLGARVSMDAIEPQVQEAAHGRRRWGEALASLGLRRPLLMRRICRLVEWAGPPEPAPASSAD
jgi:hypothetical protein